VSYYGYGNSGHWITRGGLGKLFDEVSLYAMVAVCTFQGIYLVGLTIHISLLTPIGSNADDCCSTIDIGTICPACFWMAPLQTCWW
jgi:hypothetical protein